MKKNAFAILILLHVIRVHSQAYVEPVNVSSQFFLSHYNDSNKVDMFTKDFFLSLFTPIKFGKGHVFLLRFNAEQLNVTRFSVNTQIYNLYSLSLPVGVQLQSKNAKWKFTGIVIPKINSDFKDNLDYDGQLGGAALVGYVFNPKLQIRAGLYYNSEFWGDFFMPLVGVDWKVSERFRMYGTLPGNYKFEFNHKKQVYGGFAFRSAQRSFRLQALYNDDFVRVKENQIKIYGEFCLTGKIFLGIDAYHSINYNLISYNYFHTKRPTNQPILFCKTKDAVGVTIYLSYRIPIE